MKSLVGKIIHERSSVSYTTPTFPNLPRTASQLVNENRLSIEADSESMHLSDRNLSRSSSQTESKIAISDLISNIVGDWPVLWSIGKNPYREDDINEETKFRQIIAKQQMRLKGRPPPPLPRNKMREVNNGMNNIQDKKFGLASSLLLTVSSSNDSDDNIPPISTITVNKETLPSEIMVPCAHEVGFGWYVKPIHELGSKRREALHDARVRDKIRQARIRTWELKR